MPPQGDYSQGNIHVRKARNGSVEILNPPPDSPMRKTTLFFGTFNLVATIVGGGELSLPLVFAKAGLGLATAMMIFAAIMTDFSLYLLCCCARRTGSTTYMDIVRVAFGPLAEICTTILLWMMLSGALIAYYVLLKGIFGPLVKDILSTYTSIDVGSPHFDSYVLLGIIFIIFPLKLQKNLYALRHICYVGFTSVWVVTISIGVRAYQRNKSYSEEGMDTINSQYDFSDYAGDDTHITYITKSWNDALFAFPIVVLAFLCSFNIVEVHGALQNPSRERVKTLIHTSIVACFVLFQTLGCVGYFYAYSACKGNIFLNFDPSDPVVIVGRIGMGLTLMFATTVMILPCREAFLSLVPQMKAWWKEPVQNADKLGYVSSSETKTLMSDPASFRLNSYSSLAGEHFETEMSAEGDEENTFEDENAVPGRNPFVHFITTMFIAAYAFYAAVSVPGVAIVWSVVGSSLGMIIGFIIPCACYFKIRGKKGLWRPTNLGALALLIFSVVIAFVCTIQTIIAPIKE